MGPAGGRWEAGAAVLVIEIGRRIGRGSFFEERAHGCVGWGGVWGCICWRSLPADLLESLLDRLKEPGVLERVVGVGLLGAELALGGDQAGEGADDRDQDL